MNRSIVALAPKFRLFRNKFAEITSRPGTVRSLYIVVCVPGQLRVLCVKFSYYRVF